MTAAIRCVGHFGGTAGETPQTRRGRNGRQLGRRVRPVPGNPSLVGKRPVGVRQTICLDQALVGSVQNSAD